MNVEIKLITEEEKQDINLINKLAEVTNKGFKDLEESTKVFQSLSNLGRSVNVVKDRIEGGFKIVKGEEVIGCFFLSNFKDNSCLSIGPISILPEHQNGGIGKQILSFATEFLKKINAKNLQLSVDSTNLKAMSVYLKSGFKFFAPIVWLKGKFSYSEENFLKFCEREELKKYDIKNFKVDFMNENNLDECVKLSDKLIFYNRKNYFSNLIKTCSKNENVFKPLVFKINDKIVGFTTNFSAYGNTLINGNETFFIFVFLYCFIKKLFSFDFVYENGINFPVYYENLVNFFLELKDIKIIKTLFLLKLFETEEGNVLLKKDQFIYVGAVTGI